MAPTFNGRETLYKMITSLVRVCILSKLKKRDILRDSPHCFEIVQITNHVSLECTKQAV